MKPSTTLGMLLLACITSNAQSNWSPLVSIEENIHLTDVAPSYNYLNLSVPAGNAGMRMGAYYTHNSQLSAEITLGVVGVGTPGAFSNTMIPVEAVGHYNLLDGMNVKLPSKFNLDLGVGFGLAESSSGNFGFSEHVVSGASMELPHVVPFGTLIIGIRYTSFFDDYIDGTVVNGSSTDGVLRFCAAVRLDGTYKKLATALIEAESKVKKLKADHAIIEKAHSEKIALTNTENKKLNSEKTALVVELDALKASQSEMLKEVKEAKSAPTIKKQYHVVIGSFPSQEMAENYAEMIDEETSIVPVNELSTFRVVLSIHDKLNQALSALENAREITSTAWIAVN